MPRILPAFLLALLALALTSCSLFHNDGGSSSAEAPAPRGHSPHFTLVHVAGKITRMPVPSSWPASISVGTPFSYWAVLDNHVRDEHPGDPHRGTFAMKGGGPARFDARVGSLHFSSDQVPGRAFTVTTKNQLGGHEDGYDIDPATPITLPNLPGLHMISATLRLHTHNRSHVDTDYLPLHVFPLYDLSHHPQEQLVIDAYTTDPTHPSHDQTLQGRADLFEVFDAWNESASARQ